MQVPVYVPVSPWDGTLPRQETVLCVEFMRQHDRSALCAHGEVCVKSKKRALTNRWGHRGSGVYPILDV